MKKINRKTSARAAALSLALVAGGCATVDEYGAFESVSGLVAERSKGDVLWYRDPESRQVADARVRQILARPLTRDTAVELMFLRSPQVQAKLAGVGISAADLAQAGRLENPIISIARISGGGVTEIERQVLASVLSLLTLDARKRIAESEARRVNTEIALQILGMADAVERAWIDAVAARERVVRVKRIDDAAKAAGDLADRMAEAGSMPQIEQARMKSFVAESAAQLGRSLIASDTSRERLVRAIGLWGGEARIKLPSDLPRLPRLNRNLGGIEREALMNRLDIRANRAELERMAKVEGLTDFTSVVSLLELSGYAITEKERDGGETTKVRSSGVEVELAVPIFDPGDAKRSRAHWQYVQAQEALRAQAIAARSEVREAYLAYRGAYDLARHYEGSLMPLSAQVTQQELLRYNGMLVSVFELLTTVRQQYQTEMNALDARRDFWLAARQLEFATLTGSGQGVEMAGDASGGEAAGAAGH